MSQKNIEIAEAYFTAMENHNLVALEKILFPLLHFKDPMGEHHNRESFLETAEKLFSILKEIHIRARFASETQALFLYDMVFSHSAKPATAANLMTFENGQIKTIEVVYDARPFENPVKKIEYAKKELGR